MNDASSAHGNSRRFIAGRVRELEVFREAFSRMLSGRRQLVLISGEAGIGKTRCAEAVAELAEDQGALVLWGRCHEEAGAPPYWPWVQILRAYVAASSLDEVRLNMGTAAHHIAALLPELVDASQRTHSAPAALGDANAARFRTFDAIGQFLLKATQQVPITLVLDNLHWADAPSLSLLEFLTQELTLSRLLLVGTYRDMDLSTKTPLLSALGGLGRESDAHRVHLAGLSRTAIGEVAERMCGVALSESVIGTICRQTDGNPLFAIELIKVLIDESAGTGIAAAPTRIPAGVRETIGRRLLRLSARCNALLGVAAVYGRGFTAREIAAAADEDVQEVLTGLEPALQAGIVQCNADVAGSYQFTHALIRDTIYEELSTSDRLRMHGRAGDALVSVHSAQLEPALTRVAHHYHEAAALGNPDKAVVFALRAADSSVRVLAYEDSLLHYDRAIETLKSSGLMHDERLARLYILKGLAQIHLGQVQRSIDVLLEAVSQTRILGSAELLVDALMYLAHSSSHVAQRHLLPLLDDALTLLPDGDSVARAKALATRAFAQRTLADNSRIQVLVDEALAMARRSCDATARCACYQVTVLALRGNPENLHRRLLLGEEYIAAARATSSGDLLAEAYDWQALNYLESGQLDELETLLEHYDSLISARVGLHQYRAAAYGATLALLRGEWADLESQIEALLEIGTKTRSDDAHGVYGAQMFTLNRDLGRLQSLAPHIERIVASTGRRTWEPGLMLMCAEIGMLDEARRIFNRFAEQDFRAICRDDMYMTCLVFCAETCCALGDAERAVMLYELLRPYAGQTAVHPTAVCFGAAELYLAMLACAAKWTDRARDHFNHAISLNRTMRAWPWLARSLFRHGAFLIALQTDADRRVGRQQLREAEHLARRFGMTRLIDDINALLHGAGDGVTFPDDLTAREVEVLRLLAIGRTNKDVSLVLSISLNTVATHVRSILNKTQCANRTEAAAYAIRHGLQSSESPSIAI